MKKILVSLFLFSLMTNPFQAFQAADQMANGNSTLLWDAPTTNEDGTPLTDLAGYTIGVFPIDGIPGTTAPLATLNVTTTNSVVTSITSLAAVSEGRFRFAVLAVDTHGNKSLWSAPLDLDLKTKKPKQPNNIRCNS